MALPRTRYDKAIVAAVALLAATAHGFGWSIPEDILEAATGLLIALAGVFGVYQVANEGPPGGKSDEYPPEIGNRERGFARLSFLQLLALMAVVGLLASCSAYDAINQACKDATSCIRCTDYEINAGLLASGSSELEGRMVLMDGALPTYAEIKHETCDVSVKTGPIDPDAP